VKHRGAADSARAENDCVIVEHRRSGFPA
jgi:hypothetical protein